ncbi:hypothetical protein H4582DRAFT_2064082 [Lactarius indigo]|nr:hypothetical protein H4582DRAFT_2064082 [Lactarius indigo]
MSDALTISRVLTTIKVISGRRAMRLAVSKTMSVRQWPASCPSICDRLEGPRDFEEKEIDLMSREQKRTEAQECGHDIKIQNNEQRWPVLGIIRMNVIWTTKVGDRPENKQHAWDAPAGAKGIATQLAAAAPLQWHKSVAA